MKTEKHWMSAVLRRVEDVAEDILQYLQGAEIIIHNAAFDVGFLNKELELTGRPAFRTYVESVTDTLAMAKDMYPGKRNSLDALCDRLGVDNSGRTLHGALLDAELLADVKKAQDIPMESDHYMPLCRFQPPRRILKHTRHMKHMN